MNKQPHRRHQLLEALELAGRGRDDLYDPAPGPFDAMLAARPELTEVHRRSVQLDEVLGRVVRDVPVPQGLEGRILARLDERPAPCSVGSTIGRSVGGFSRRRWIVVSAGVVAASLVVAALAGLGAFSKGYTSAGILDEAISRLVGGDAVPGEPVSAGVLASYPPSRDVRRWAGARCRDVDDFLGRRAVAYELAAWEGTRATLFVLPWKRPVDGLDTRPPNSPHRATGGTAAGAWQADGMLYVLVVQGDPRAYRSFLAPARPLT